MYTHTHTHIHTHTHTSNELLGILKMYTHHQKDEQEAVRHFDSFRHTEDVHDLHKHHHQDDQEGNHQFDSFPMLSI